MGMKKSKKIIAVPYIFLISMFNYIPLIRPII